MAVSMTLLFLTIIKCLHHIVALGPDLPLAIVALAPDHHLAVVAIGPDHPHAIFDLGPDHPPLIIAARTPDITTWFQVFLM